MVTPYWFLDDLNISDDYQALFVALALVIVFMLVYIGSKLVVRNVKRFIFIATLVILITILIALVKIGGDIQIFAASLIIICILIYGFINR